MHAVSEGASSKPFPIGCVTSRVLTRLVNLISSDLWGFLGRLLELSLPSSALSAPKDRL